MTASTTTPADYLADLDSNGRLLDALLAHPSHIGAAYSYAATIARSVIYLYTGDGGTVVVTPDSDEYAVAYAPRATLDAAIDWLGTRSDAEAGTEFHATATDAINAFYATLAAHAEHEAEVYAAEHIDGTPDADTWILDPTAPEWAVTAQSWDEAPF